jgi:hypothetical protein
LVDKNALVTVGALFDHISPPSRRNPAKRMSLGQSDTSVPRYVSALPAFTTVLLSLLERLDEFCPISDMNDVLTLSISSSADGLWSGFRV